MIDYALEQQLKDVKELLEGWNVFREYYKIGESKEKPTREQEDAFLECKKRIAMLHDEFMESLPPADSAANRKKEKDGKSIIKYVIHCVTIKHIHTFYNNQHREFERDWNDCYMLLNETIEKLETKKSELAKISYTQLAASELQKKIRKRLKEFLTGPALKYGGVVLALILIPFVLQYTGLYDLKDIPLDFPKLAPAYYPMERAFRRIAYPALAFTSLEHTERYQGELPAGYTKPDLQPLTTKEQAIQLMVSNEFGQPLDLSVELQPAVEFLHENYFVEANLQLDMFIFRMPTNAEAEAVIKQYLLWLDSLSNENKNRHLSTTTFFKTNNIVVILHSESEAGRNYFKLREWGVR